MNNLGFYRGHHFLQEDIVFLPAQLASLHDKLSFLNEQSGFLPGLPLSTGGYWISTCTTCVAT